LHYFLFVTTRFADGFFVDFFAAGFFVFAFGAGDDDGTGEVSGAGTVKENVCFPSSSSINSRRLMVLCGSGEFVREP